MTTKTCLTEKRLAYSVPESAEKAGVSVATINALIKDNTLPSVLLGGRRLIHWTALDTLLGGALSADRGPGDDSDECLTLTVAELTERTPLSEATVNARIADGTIPSLKVAKRRLIRRDVIDSILRGDTATVLSEVPSGRDAK